MSVIVQHVQESAPDLERRAKRAGVVSVGKDRTAAPDACVQATREPHCEPLHRARERASSLRFYDEVDVVRLNRILHQACSEALLDGAERRKDQGGQRPVSDARKPPPHPHRDVQWMSRLELGAAYMRHACLRARWLPTSAPSSPAAKSESQIELSERTNSVLLGHPCSSLSPQ
jgi:hypothetical protein